MPEGNQVSGVQRKVPVLAMESARGATVTTGFEPEKRATETLPEVRLVQVMDCTPPPAWMTEFAPGFRTCGGQHEGASHFVMMRAYSGCRPVGRKPRRQS